MALEGETKQRVQRTVRILLQEAQTIDVLYKDELMRAATTMGNIMSPQLYNYRLHGENNAVSMAIRSCCEALFWLSMEDGHEDAINSVEELLSHLANPQLRTE